MSIRPVLPTTELPPDSAPERMRFNVERELALIKLQLKLLYEGRISAHYSATAPPTGGRWVAGDIVHNSAPVAAGGAGSVYVVSHWLCTVTGDPGTWVECRNLTGG